MASEDSDHLGSGFPAIHRLRDLDYVDKAAPRKVMPFGDQLHAESKALEIDTLRAMQRERPEEGNDLPEQILPSANDQTMQVLTVVVAAPVDDDLPDSEESV
jgi:hypothetical protein